MEIETIEMLKFVNTNDETREEKFAWSFTFFSPFSFAQSIFPIPKTFLNFYLYFYKS